VQPKSPAHPALARRSSACTPTCSTGLGALHLYQVLWGDKRGRPRTQYLSARLYRAASTYVRNNQSLITTHPLSARLLLLLLLLLLRCVCIAMCPCLCASRQLDLNRSSAPPGLRSLIRTTTRRGTHALLSTLPDRLNESCARCE
jgi:hypothetical protein